MTSTGSHTRSIFADAIVVCDAIKFVGESDGGHPEAVIPPGIATVDPPNKRGIKTTNTMIINIIITTAIPTITAHSEPFIRAFGSFLVTTLILASLIFIIIDKIK